MRDALNNDLYAESWGRGTWGYHRQGSCQAGLAAAVAEVGEQEGEEEMLPNFLLRTGSICS